MSTLPEIDFDSLVNGIPGTVYEFKVLFKQKLAEKGSGLLNGSELSPFGVLFCELMAEPLLSLRKDIVERVLPATFLATATGAELDYKADSVGLVRTAASKAQGTIIFTRSSSSGDLVIPSGSVVGSTVGNYRMVTLSENIIAEGSLSADVLCEADESGAGYNLGAGYYRSLITPIHGITAVYNDSDWLVTPGVDQESDDSLRERCRLQFHRQVEWFTADTYRVLIYEALAGAVPIENVLFDTNIPRGPGSADIYIYLDTGFVSQELIDQANSHIRDGGRHGLGDDVEVKTFPQQSWDIEVEGRLKSGADSGAIQDGIETLIRAIFGENSVYQVERFRPTGYLSRSLMSQVIHNQFPDVIGLNWIQPNADLQAHWTLPVLGSITITIV